MFVFFRRTCPKKCFPETIFNTFCYFEHPVVCLPIDTCSFLQSTSQLENTEKAISKLQNDLEAFEGKSVADAEAVIQAQHHYHAVSAGLSSNDDGEEKTLADQLMGKFLTILILGVNSKYLYLTL